MIHNKKVLALVTARMGSKGLPYKNKKLLLGKPLLQYPIETALSSKYIDELFLSTDDPEMQLIGIRSRAFCPELRPSELSSDTASSFSVINYVLDYYRNNKKLFDYLILLEPTSPLTEPQDVDGALEVLENSRDIADAIVGVASVESQHPNFLVKITAERTLIPYLSEYSSARRQDIDPVYHLDGSFYISEVATLLNKEAFYHNRTLGFVMPKWKSMEIDDIADFYAVEGVLKNKDKIK